MPKGLTISPTGVLSGTPKTSGGYTVTVEVESKEGKLKVSTALGRTFGQLISVVDPGLGRESTVLRALGPALCRTLAPSGSVRSPAVAEEGLFPVHHNRRSAHAVAPCTGVPAVSDALSGRDDSFSDRFDQLQGRKPGGSDPVGGTGEYPRIGYERRQRAGRVTSR